MSLLKDITKFFNRSSKKRDLSDQSKEGNRGDELIKIRDKTNGIESLSEMSDGVFAKSFKSSACVEILFNCLRNVEKQTEDILLLGNQLRNNRLRPESSCMTYMTLYNLFQTNIKNTKKTAQKRKNEIIGKLQSQDRTLSSKVSKFEK